MTTTVLPSVPPPTAHRPSSRRSVNTVAVIVAVVAAILVGAVYAHGKATTSTAQHHYATAQANIVNLQSKIKTVQDQLYNTQTDLNNSKADTVRTQQLARDLGTCLDGYMNAEQDTLNFDYSAASNDLAAVQGVCGDAFSEQHAEASGDSGRSA